MLLRHEAPADGIEVLAVSGPCAEADGAPLVAEVERALEQAPRGVVLDLGGVTDVEPGAGRMIGSLRDLPAGWPRATLVVCPPEDGAGEALDLHGLLVSGGRSAAVDSVLDRSDRPRAVLQLEPGPSGPSQARAAAADCARELGLDESTSDDVLLLVSEMVTNAVRHAEPPVGLEIEVDEDAVVVVVRDGSPSEPVARDAAPDAEGGRGMMLVDLLTDEHGVRPQPPGKVVWARLRRRPES